jgi:hypothetical protein
MHEIILRVLKFLYEKFAVDKTKEVRTAKIIKGVEIALDSIDYIRKQTKYKRADVETALETASKTIKLLIEELK